jgi:hypothetical protein
MVPFSLVAVLFNPVSTAGTAAVIGWWLHAVVIAFFAAYVLKLAPHAAVQEVGNRRR